jgi:hypothetical protein
VRGGFHQEEPGLNGIGEPPIYLAGMPTVLKRLLTLGLALALIVSATPPLVPCGMGESEIGVRADMAGGCDEPQAPRTGHLPTCIGHIGCLAVTALPASPAVQAVAFQWTSLDFEFGAASLSGISLKPELSPPILAT